MRKLILFLFLPTLCGCGTPEPVEAGPELWLFYGVGIRDANDQAWAKTVIDRAKAAGYYGVYVPNIIYKQPSDNDHYPAWAIEWLRSYIRHKGMKYMAGVIFLHYRADYLLEPFTELREPYGGDKPGSEGKAHICLSDERQWPLHEKHIQIVERWLQPDAYLLHHEEIRLAGWCEKCRLRKLPELLGEHITRCAALCNSPVYVWSDMLDPWHNASDRLYWNRESFRGAAEHIPPEVRIINWNCQSYYSFAPVDANNVYDPNGTTRCERSLVYFAAQSRWQIVAGAYEAEPWEATRLAIQIGLKKKAIRGAGYFNWGYTNAYPPGSIERYAEMVRAVWKDER